MSKYIDIFCKYFFAKPFGGVENENEMCYNEAEIYCKVLVIAYDRPQESQENAERAYWIESARYTVLRLKKEEKKGGFERC